MYLLHNSLVISYFLSFVGCWQSFSSSHSKFMKKFIDFIIDLFIWNSQKLTNSAYCDRWAIFSTIQICQVLWIVLLRWTKIFIILFLLLRNSSFSCDIMLRIYRWTKPNINTWKEFLLVLRIDIRTHKDNRKGSLYGTILYHVYHGVVYQNVSPYTLIDIIINQPQLIYLFNCSIFVDENGNACHYNQHSVQWYA